MGQHKYNPTAIAAKNGELPKKDTPKMSKRELERYLRNKIYDECIKFLDPDRKIIKPYFNGGDI